jgi:hypothetical protein
MRGRSPWLVSGIVLRAGWENWLYGEARDAAGSEPMRGETQWWTKWMTTIWLSRDPPERTSATKIDVDYIKCLEKYRWRGDRNELQKAPANEVALWGIGLSMNAAFRLLLGIHVPKWILHHPLYEL